MAFAAPPKRGGRFRGRQEGDQGMVMLTIKNYKEEIPKLAKCAENFDWQGDDEEEYVIFEALEEAGVLSEACLADEAPTPATAAKQGNRRRISNARPRFGARRSNFPRRIKLNGQ